MFIRKRKTVAGLLALALVLNVILISVVNTIGGAGVLSVSASTVAHTVHVNGSTGSDTNGNGSTTSPFRTIDRARRHVRTLSKTGGDIVVMIADGFYALDEPLRFDENDSGTNSCTIRYVAAPGASPIISGGKRLTGSWSVATDVNWLSGGLVAYRAPLARNSKLRGIYVDGKPAFMTLVDQTANGRVAPGVPEYQLNRGDAAWVWRNVRRSQATSLPGQSGTNVRTSIPVNTRNAQNIEISTMNTKWMRSMVCVERLEAGTGTEAGRVIAHLQMPYAALNYNQGWGTEYIPSTAHRIQNVFEHLNNANEFYFDQRAQMLYYIPPAGQTMAGKEVIIPDIETVLVLRGTTPRSRYAQYITFEGLTFAYCDYKLAELVCPRNPSRVSRGYSSVQSAIYAIAYGNEDWHADMYRAFDVPPAAVHLTTARHIKFLDGAIIRNNMLGIHAENDVSFIEISGNNISYNAGAGIVIGHPQHIYENDQAGIHHVPGPNGGGANPNNAGPDREKFRNGTEAVPKDIIIENNFLRANCKVFTAHNSIFTFFTERMSIQRNFVFEAGYGGISVGWGWCNFDGHPTYGADGSNHLPGIPTTTSRQNIVSYNRIEDICMDLTDSGGIYTLGQQGNSYTDKVTRMDFNYINGWRDRAALDAAPVTNWINGFHPDEGSMFIIFEGNVIENIKRNTYELNNWKRKSDMRVIRGFTNMHRPETTAPRIEFDETRVEDSFWPPHVRETVLFSGLTDKYLHMIPEDAITKADIIMGSHVRVYPRDVESVASLKIRGILSAADEIWLVPAGTNTGAALDATRNNMSMAAGNATTIAIPEAHGMYELWIRYSGGRIQRSQFNLSYGVMADTRVGVAYRGTPNSTINNGTITTLDPVWDNAQALPINRFVMGPTDSNVVTGRGKALWDNDALYILVEVTDSTLSAAPSSLHNQDSVEIFFEEADARGPLQAATSWHTRVNFQNTRSHGGAAANSNFTSATMRTPTGYTVEMRMPFRHLTGTNRPTVGTVTGLEMQINNAAATGDARASVTKWNDETDNSWLDTTGWGQLVFAGAPPAPPRDGLDMWLAADRGVTLNAAGRVTGWRNQVGNHVLAPATGGEAPFLRHESRGTSYQYLQFEDFSNRLITNSFMGNASSSQYNGRQGMTMVVVAMPDREYGLWEQGNSDRYNPLYIRPWTVGDNWAGAALGLGTNGAQARISHNDGTPQPVMRAEHQIAGISTIMAMKNGTANTIHINGTQRAQLTTTGRATVNQLSGILTVGGSMNGDGGGGAEGRSETFRGRIAEVLIYGKALSAAEITELNNYLNAKYLYVPVSDISLTNTSTTPGTPLTLSATVQPSNATVSSTIQWTVVDNGGTGATVTNGVLTAARSGSVTVRATIPRGRSAVLDYTKTFTITVERQRYTGTPPVAPVLASKTDTSITLVGVQGYEYAIVEHSGSPPDEFQLSPTFTGLSPATTYYFYQRVAATATVEPSGTSSSIDVTTNEVVTTTTTAATTTTATTTTAATTTAATTTTAETTTTTVTTTTEATTTTATTTTEATTTTAMTITEATTTTATTTTEVTTTTEATTTAEATTTEGITTTTEDVTTTAEDFTTTTEDATTTAEVTTTDDSTETSTSEPIPYSCVAGCTNPVDCDIVCELHGTRECLPACSCDVKPCLSGCGCLFCEYVATTTATTTTTAAITTTASTTTTTGTTTSSSATTSSGTGTTASGVTTTTATTITTTAATTTTTGTTTTTDTTTTIATTTTTAITTETTTTVSATTTTEATTTPPISTTTATTNTLPSTTTASATTTTATTTAITTTTVVTTTTMPDWVQCQNQNCGLFFNVGGGGHVPAINGNCPHCGASYPSGIIGTTTSSATTTTGMATTTSASATTTGTATSTSTLVSTTTTGTATTSSGATTTSGSTTSTETATTGATTDTSAATTTTSIEPHVCTCDKAVCTNCSEDGKWFALGDVDGDGKITSADALEILKFMVKLPNAMNTGDNKEGAARAARIVNPSTDPTSADALEILKHMVRLTSRVDGIHINGKTV